jgi:hypothetical protein
MPTVADVARRYGQDYLDRFGASMPAEHKKTLRALGACRTGALGWVLYRCESCGRTHALGRSCGNRHCPSCQQHRTRAWLDNQLARLLPCPYFLITFTLPPELRAVARSHQRVVHAALFEASSAALRTLASNPKFVGTGRLGFFGVLHTWGRTLDYHPHVHYVVPGGGVSDGGARWMPSRAHFFVPVRALSIIFRAKFRNLLERAGLGSQVDPAVWRRDWVVHSQAAGDGRSSLQYLAQYVFRVAIGDHPIASCDDGQVTFTYRRVGSNRPRRMTLEASEFLRRFLQHVLPNGFQKVRHFGFLSPRSGLVLEAVRWLILLFLGRVLPLKSIASDVPEPPVCPRCADCGGVLRIMGVALALAPAVAVFDTS